METVKRARGWDRDFTQEFFRLAIPILLTNLVGSSLHIVDNIMVGSLGDASLAGVAQANQLAFIMRVTLFGVMSGCSIFSSQYWGVKDIVGVRRVLGMSLISAMVVCVAATVAAVVFPYAVMSIYTPDAQVAAIGAGYLRIVGPSFLLIGISSIFNASNRSTENVRLSLVAAVCAIAVNVFLNWCLIFGKLGFPQMGVNGAALATAIAAAVEAVIFVGWTYIKKYPAAAALREMKPPSRAFIRQYFHIALPVIVNEVLWATGTSAYMAVYGYMSTQSVAAMNVFSTVQQLLLAAVWGIMNATGVMVGKRIGAGKEEDAVLCGKRMMLAGLILGFILGALLLATRHEIVKIFNISEQAKQIAVSVMVTAGFTFWIRTVNSVNVVGVLRAGGDAVFSMILDGGVIWLIGVPLAYLGGLVWGLPIPLVYLLVHIEEFVKLVVGLLRFRTKKWINNLVRT